MNFKKSILTVAASIITLITLAQGNIKKEKNDTTVFLWGGLKILVFNNPDSDKSKNGIDSNYLKLPKKTPLATFYEGFDIGVNGFMNPTTNTTNLTGAAANMDIDYTRSLNLHVNLVEKQLSIYKKQLNLVSGLGLDFNGYRFNSKSITLYNDETANRINFDTSKNIAYTKNKLRVSSVEVPLLIGFSSNRKHPERGFKIAGGVIGSYVFNAKYKLNHQENSTEAKTTIKDNFHIRPFNVKATVRVGYKGFRLFANYSLLSLFKDGQGPDIRPFEVGITL